MSGIRPTTISLSVLASLLWALPAAHAENDDVPTGPGFIRARASISSLIDTVPMNSLTEKSRELVRQVTAKPTLHVFGPVEIFRGQPSLYNWMLDHPDLVVLMWRRMGARCSDIDNRGHGRFGWHDRAGADIHWDTIYREPGLLVWYAEGTAVPNPMLPGIQVRAVVVLHYNSGRDAQGRTLLCHQAELFFQTDSKAVALIARLVGISAPQLAEECVGQMELFYSGPVWYLDRHPERRELLLLQGLAPASPLAQEIRKVLEQVPRPAAQAPTSYNASKCLAPPAE